MTNGGESSLFEYGLMAIAIAYIAYIFIGKKEPSPLDYINISMPDSIMVNTEFTVYGKLVHGGEPDSGHVVYVGQVDEYGNDISDIGGLVIGPIITDVNGDFSANIIPSDDGYMYLRSYTIEQVPTEWSH